MTELPYEIEPECTHPEGLSSLMPPDTTDYQRQVEDNARAIYRAWLVSEGHAHPNGYLRYGSYAAMSPYSGVFRLIQYGWHGLR